jgi:hypothetical protein
MRWPMRATMILAVSSLVVAACGSDEEEPADPATWAAGVCAAGQEFAQAIADSRDPRDPSSLDLDARKQRAARLGEAEVAASEQLAEDLRAIEPPEEAKEYHDALIAQAEEFIDAIQEQVDAIEDATTAQQIAVANAEVQFRLDGSAQQVTAAAAGVPEDLVQELMDQPQCGEVPVPVPGGPDTSPTPGMPTPSA